MQFRNTAALLLSALYFATGTSALVSCAVCAPTIVYAGVTRTLTLSREESGNTVQCNYDTPAIPGFSPACLYRNVDGVLIFTNTAGTLWSLPGSCPSVIPRVQKTSC